MSKVITKDGVEIFYKDWGRKDAQPLVFHHGWRLSSDHWDAQMLYFLDEGYRIVAHDRRGRGRSWRTQRSTYGASSIRKPRRMPSGLRPK
jgi:non-heme chloroperoxidase